MAAPREWSEEENDEEIAAEKIVSELRSAKKELLEKTRPINDELERIAQREREYVDKLNRIRAEKHEREKYQQTVQRLIELESELKRVKCKNVKLKQSLDQAAKHSKIQLKKAAELDSRAKVAERELHLSKVQARSEIHDSKTVSELQKQLSETRKLLNQAKEELNETRQRLLDVQERLTVAEQVTAATRASRV